MDISDTSDNSDRRQQLEQWKTDLYRIGRSADGVTASDAELLEQWCNHLHQAAIQLSPYVHSFYVCLYEPEVDANAPLHFVCGFDEGYRGEIARRPLGSGPTSLVARTGQPYILTPQTRLYQAGGNRFGQTGRASLSAVHLPLRQWRSGTPATVLRGVVSAQSYRPGLWTQRDAPFVQDLQARIDEAADYWFNTLQKGPAPD